MTLQCTELSKTLSVLPQRCLWDRVVGILSSLLFPPFLWFEVLPSREKEEYISCPLTLDLARWLISADVKHDMSRDYVYVPVIQLGLGAFAVHLQKTCPGNYWFKENGKACRADLNPSLSQELCASDPTQPQQNHKHLQTCKWEISGMLVMQHHGNNNWLIWLGKQLSLKCPLSRWNIWDTEKVRICPSSQPEGEG